MADHQQNSASNSLADSPSMDRRGFLRSGLGGVLFLGTVSMTTGLAGCATAPSEGSMNTSPTATPAGAYRFGFLTEEDVVLFEALLPAMVGPALPEAPEQRRKALQETIQRIDAGIVQFGPANQKELRGLFDLLNFGFTRVTVARVWSSWKNVDTATAHAFLERWRTSGIGLFNNGYIALTKISNVAFYGHRDHWHISGYPGPPQFAVDALPQFKTGA